MEPKLNPLISIYKPLYKSEDYESISWDKSTVVYAQSHCKSLKEHIAKMARKYYGRIIDSSTIEDIYEDTLLTLARTCDFDYSTAMQCAMEESENGMPSRQIELGDYVKIQFKFGTMRHLSSNTAKYEKCILNQEVKEAGSDSNRTCLVDLQVDPNAHKFTEVTELEQVCQLINGDRYRYSLGKDIFTVLFVNLCAMRKYGCEYNTKVNEVKEAKKAECVKSTLDVLGISKNDIASICGKYGAEELFGDLILGVNSCGIEESIEVLSRYVFGAYQIKRSIMEYKN